MKLKLVKTLLAAAAISCAFSVVSLAGAWQQDGARWKYQKDDGAGAVNQWVNDSGAWYYFDGSGYMQTGWLQLGADWYYLEPSGAMRTAPLTENQITYNFTDSGICTNPGAAAPVMSEDQYLEKLLQFIQKMYSVTSDAQKQLNDLNTNDWAGVARIFTDMKIPFTEFMNINPPAKFAQVHDHLKNGCVSMTQYLDIMIDIANHPNASRSEINQKMTSATDLSTKAEAEFNAAASLLNSIR